MSLCGDLDWNFIRKSPCSRTLLRYHTQTRSSFGGEEIRGANWDQSRINSWTERLLSSFGVTPGLVCGVSDIEWGIVTGRWTWGRQRALYKDEGAGAGRGETGRERKKRIDR